MLNLYQNVSSSLAYISDLQELLTTITGIVTSELLCEESSVLLYDQETHEFKGPVSLFCSLADCKVAADVVPGCMGEQGDH